MKLGLQQNEPEDRFPTENFLAFVSILYEGHLKHWAINPALLSKEVGLPGSKASWN